MHATKLSTTMHRIWAIIERDLRRFRRSPTLMIMSMVMPLVQLWCWAMRLAGRSRTCVSAWWTRTTAMPAIKLKEMFQAVAANARTFDTGRRTTTRRRRCGTCATGRSTACWTFRRISRARCWPGLIRRWRLIEDNTDQFPPPRCKGRLTALVAALQPGGAAPRVTAAADAVGGRGLSVRAVHPVPAAGDHRRWRFLSRR